MVGSEARVLCYCATDDVFFQFTALLHGFKSLPPVPSRSEILIGFRALLETLSSGVESLFSSITELEALHSAVIATPRIPTPLRTFC